MISEMKGMKSRVGERGQVTIPKRLRARLGIRPGSVLEFQESKGKLIAIKSGAYDPVGAVTGCLGSGMDTDKLIDELRGPV